MRRVEALFYFGLSMNINVLHCIVNADFDVQAPTLRIACRPLRRGNRLCRATALRSRWLLGTLPLSDETLTNQWHSVRQRYISVEVKTSRLYLSKGLCAIFIVIICKFLTESLTFKETFFFFFNFSTKLTNLQISIQQNLNKGFTNWAISKLLWTRLLPINQHLLKPTDPQTFWFPEPNFTQPPTYEAVKVFCSVLPSKFSQQVFWGMENINYGSC